MPSDIEDATAKESSFRDDGGAGKEKGPTEETGGPPSLLVYYNALSRLLMAVFLICAGVYTDPAQFNKTPPGGFYYCAVFFIAGTGIFLTVTLIDLANSKGTGCIAILNSSLYVIAAGSLLAGSIFFYPDVDSMGHPIGQYLYVVGTIIIFVAILWDVARLLKAGNAVPLPFIVALFSALLGAVAFNYGALFLMPDVGLVAKASKFFIAGGICFAIHALAVIKAYLL